MVDDKHVTLETKIDRVVAYLDGARIYRSGSIELKKGFQQIRIKKLTKNLRKDSVRVSGKGKGSIGAIDVETVYQEEVSHEELNKLVQEEKKLKKELQALQQKYDFTVKQNERLKALSEKFSVEFPQWLASGETQLTTLSTFIDFENKNNVEFLKKKQSLEDEIEDLNKKIQTLNNQISIYQNQSRTEQTFEIAIGVDVAQTGPFIFELSYQTSGVSWNPTYDVDLKIDKAILKGMAQVVNRTLEDWIDVSLEISTAVFRPLRVVEPTPFYIDIYDPYARPPPSPGYGMKAKRMAPSAPKAMERAKEEAVMALDEAPMEEMYEPTAELKESPSGVQSFEISGKWTIPSDGNNHPVTLTTHELKTDKEFYWSSTDGLGVIAQDKITNGDAVILAGNAKVYSEGEFIGETYIAKIAPGEEFKLGAREEMKMKAEKKLVKRVREKAGVVKGKRNIYYEYEIIIKNFRKEDSFIVIKDVVPYSRSERIKVKNIEPNIVPTKDNLGIYTWEITVKTGAETKITYNFDVEWEKDYEITPSLP